MRDISTIWIILLMLLLPPSISKLNISVKYLSLEDILITFDSIMPLL